ncbi:hypothetical protein LXL04_015762 [Taraxacum kok-saghyz]
MGNTCLKLQRLDDMLHVGITEDHRESATKFGNVVGALVIAQLMASIVNNDTLEHGPSISYSTNDNDQMTVGKLMKTYGTCISELRSSQSKTCTASLKRISPANFTKEEKWDVIFSNIDTTWTVVYFLGFMFLTFLICFYKSAKRRISKIKV